MDSARVRAYESKRVSEWSIYSLDTERIGIGHALKFSSR